MKKILIIAAAIMALAIGAFAQETPSYKMVLGGGARINLYATGVNEVIPVEYVGFCIPASTTGTYSFLVPHELYTITSYGRFKQEGQTVYTGLYEIDMKGVWYFNPEATKWHPFFMGGVALDIVNQPGADQSYLNGEFGLGTGLSFTPKYGLWTAGTLAMGADITSKVGLGLYFKL